MPSPRAHPRFDFRNNRNCRSFVAQTEVIMAVNKPTGDNARKGAVKKRSQLQTKTMGKKTWTKRDRTTGEFMDQKKAPAKKKFKGVRRER
jgi:hypothetical protein